MYFVSCYKEKKEVEICMDEKLGIKKPPFGYFSQLRVHDSARPKPKSYAVDFKDPTIGYDEDFEKKTSKLGNQPTH